MTVNYADNQGVSIAYHFLGEEGPNIVQMSSSLHSVDASQVPHFRFWADVAMWLAGRYRYVFVEPRGVGGSDRPVDGYKPQTFAQDLGCVIDQAGLAPTGVYAWADVTPVAIIYAAAHPEKVSRLILDTATARLLEVDGYPAGVSVNARDAYLSLVRANFSMFAQALVRGYHPFLNDAAVLDWAKRWMAGTSREIALKWWTAWYDADVRHLLKEIRCPTLVVHREADRVVPAASAHYLHEQIEGSRLVTRPRFDPTQEARENVNLRQLIDEFLREGP